MIDSHYYGSPKVASFQITAGAEKNAHFSQGPEASSLPKVRKGAFAAHHMPQLRVLQGYAGKRRTCQAHKERTQTEGKRAEVQRTWQVGTWQDPLQCSLCTSGTSLKIRGN
jgi:hypothetical protein